MMRQNPYSKYKQTSVETATPEQLMFMLFDGGIKFLNQAEKHIEDKEVLKANEKLKKAQQILRELMNSLNHEKGGEFAANQLRLYDYMHYELLQANMKKDKEKVQQVREMLFDIKSTFQQAHNKLNRSEDDSPAEEVQAVKGGVNESL